jgi:hypothetical protein
MASSRKRLKLQDDTLVKELEDNLTASISSGASLNTLADLVSLTISLRNPQAVLKAIYACYRVFVLSISKGFLENSTSEQEKLVRLWILERLDEYVRFLTGLLQDEESLLRVRPTSSDFIFAPSLTSNPDFGTQYPHVALEASFFLLDQIITDTAVSRASFQEGHCRAPNMPPF